MTPPRPPLSLSIALRIAAAERLGCTVECLDPETNYLHRVHHGQRAFLILGSASPLNGVVAGRVARDKFYTSMVLGRLGARGPATARCLMPGHFDHDDFASHVGTGPAERFAAERGYPLIVKPNSGSRGRLVNAVDNEAEMFAALEAAWGLDPLALVQERVVGIDLRLDFLDGELLLGYVRRPVVVVGDGLTSLRDLLAAIDPRFAGERFWLGLEADPIWRRKTAGRVGLDSVLAEGEEVDLRSDVLNLNRLCTAELITELPERWLEAGRAIARALELRHLGVDFKIEDTRHPLDSDPAEATVIEVNSSPSLAQMSRMGHYEATVEAEIRIVEAILSSRRVF